MTEGETLALQLDAMAGQIRRWLEWDREKRDKGHLTTDGNTHIMSLPVPFWPTHGQFENWIKAMAEAGKRLREDR